MAAHNERFGASGAVPRTKGGADFQVLCLVSSAVKAPPAPSCRDVLRDTLELRYFRQEIYILQIGDNLTKGFTYQKFYLDSLGKHNPELFRYLFNESVKESMDAMRRTGDISYIQNN